MDNDQIRATTLMTFDKDNPGLYSQGQVIFHDGSFYTVDKDNPAGMPQESTSDYTEFPSDAVNLLVSPGAGATGTAAEYNPQLNNLTFAVAGATGAGKAKIDINVAAGASGPVVTFDGSSIVRMVNNLMVTQTYDPGQGEQDTGATYNGKAVYRRAFEFTTDRAANSQDDRMLISEPGYVDAIVNTGGYWMTGNQAEKFPATAAYVAPQSIYGFAYVSTTNQLVFRSNSSLNRDGSKETASAFVWVDYTRVDDTAPQAPSSV